MREVVAVEVEGFTIRYFRTEGEVHLCDATSKHAYGVAATKYIGDKEEESVDAGLISEDEGYVDELITILSKNTVTPAVLCEMLDEMLC